MLIEFDNTMALVKPENKAEHDALTVVREDAKVVAPGAKYMYAHKLYLRTHGKKGWDGKTSIISKAHPVTGSSHMPTGLLPTVYQELLSMRVLAKDIRFNDLRATPKAQGTGLHNLTLRGYQQDAFDIAMDNTFNDMHWPQGVFKMATGCVDMDTEYLSPTGWIKIHKYDGGKVGQYHEDGTLSFVVPDRFIKLPANNLWEIKSKYGINQCLSDEHTVVYKATKQSCTLSKLKFSTIKQRHEKNSYGFRGWFLTTFTPSIKTELTLSDTELRLQVAAIADGYFDNKSKTSRCTIRLKKERKINRLKNLLKISNTTAYERICKTTGYSVFSFTAPFRIKVYDKRFYRCSLQQLNIIAEECLYWDGDQVSRFSTTIKESADFIQYAFSSSGYRASICVKDRRLTKGHIEYSVNRTSSILTSISKGASTKIEIKKHKPIDGFKYCFTVPTQMLVLRRNNCIFVTGNSGKTELACALYQGIKVPTVFVVHRKHLIKQTRDRFSKYGVTTGQIGDSVFAPDEGGITVATIQTIHNTLKGGDSAKIATFIRARQVFFDEAHLCAASLDKGNQFILLSRQFRHAYYRWGLTATPFMRDQYSNQLLMGATGDVLYSISNDQLIKAGHLTKPKVTIIKCPPVKGPRTYPEVYDSAIVLNRWRNIKIIDELLKAQTPAIIMCNRITHAKIIANIAKHKGLILPVVQGSTSSAERANILADLQSSKEKAIIATTVFDEGVDIPELRTIILAGAGKSKVAQLQRIGRGLRRATGKKEFTLIDFDDSANGRIMKSHSASRRKLWEDEKFDIEER